MKIHDFNDSILVGEKGEEKVKKFLECRFPVIDLRDNKIYQEQDIDFMSDNENHYTFEVKTDTYTTGNMFLETTSAMEIDSTGWLYKTKADYVLYYFVNYARLVVLDRKRLLAWFNENKDNLQEYRKLLKNTYSGGYYTTEGYAIPVKKICESVPHKVVVV